MVFMRAARVDGNQKEIVTGLRKIGFSVLIISQLKNCCDIVVGAKGRNYLIEIKDPAQPPSKRRLTEGEQGFFDNWNGQVDKVETIEEIINIIDNIV